MKKIIISVAALALLASPMLALAEVSFPDTFSTELEQDADVASILNAILDWGLGILLVLGVLAFVVAGILYITAGGDEDRIKTAKSVMVFAIIGIVVGLLGMIVVNTIQGLLAA